MSGAEPSDCDGLSDYVLGTSDAMMSAMTKLRRVAPTSLLVLLLGDSGTGKSLLARAIHDLSPRRSASFVKVNCAALPETLLESELFGHEKGAFTGALAQRKGRFELADGGTLFLDEIGDISPAFQSKLLRVLQEREFERVGGNTTIRVDVRVIAATNCNLEAAVAAGRFRGDLYFRLAIVPIRLPALRDRREDIPLFAQRTLRQFNHESAEQLTFAPDALAVLSNCSFPGNIRELENCVRRTAIMAEGPVIDASHFACRGEGCPNRLMRRALETCRTTPAGRYLAEERRQAQITNGAHRNGDDRIAFPRNPRRSRIIDPDRLIEAMRKSGWSQARAGRLLGLSARQVGYALRRHGIEVLKI